MKNIMKYMTLALALALMVCAFAAPVFAAESASQPYRATVMLREVGHPTRACGSVAVRDNMARLDADLGGAGMFRALVRPQDKVMYVLADDLKAYVSIPLKGDETGMRDYARRAAEAMMPFGVPALSLREEGRQTFGEEYVGDYVTTRGKSRFIAELMGMITVMDLMIWESPTFGPFPVKVQKMRSLDAPEATGDLVELTDIRFGPVPQSLLDMPEGYSRYSSVLDLLLYALSRQ